MSRPVHATAEQRAAARLRMVLDERLGRPTPAWVIQLATAEPAVEPVDQGVDQGVVDQGAVDQGVVDTAGAEVGGPEPGVAVVTELPDADTPRTGIPVPVDADSRWFAMGGPAAAGADVPAESAVAEDVPAEDAVAEGAVAESDAVSPEAASSAAVADGGWAGPADAGWAAARTLSAEPEDVTEAGLPKRMPLANLVPGSIQDGPGDGAKPVPAAPDRSAVAVRERMANLQRGTERGRQELVHAYAAEPLSAPGD